VVLPLPPAAARKDTSYVAAVGKQVSPAVSLKQRISITGITSYTNNSWQISGEVRPYTNKQILVLQQRVGCGQWEIAWSAFWGTAATGNKNSGYFYATGQHLNGGAVYRVVILPAPNPYYYNGKESVIAASLQVAV
jgi:hypothetical protein